MINRSVTFLNRFARFISILMACALLIACNKPPIESADQPQVQAKIQAKVQAAQDILVYNVRIWRASRQAVGIRIRG